MDWIKELRDYNPSAFPDTFLLLIIPKNLARFAHNWNDGIVESWKTGYAPFHQFYHESQGFFYTLPVAAGGWYPIFPS
jgi:hypothetical protein